VLARMRDESFAGGGLGTSTDDAFSHPVAEETSGGC
jgi:hypothetical protein